MKQLRVELMDRIVDDLNGRGVAELATFAESLEQHSNAPGNVVHTTTTKTQHAAPRITRRTAKRTTSSQGDKTAQVVAFVTKNPGARSGVVAENLGLSKVYASRLLKQAVQTKQIKRSGEKAKTTYSVK